MMRDPEEPNLQQQLNSATNNEHQGVSKSSTEVRLTDEEFMEVIRDFPGVYDKNHEDFRDKTRKEECWEKISDILNVRIEDTKRRYETIRTRLSRYLKRIKEGYWTIETKDIKLDFLHWLVPYIKTRDAPFQYKHDNKRDFSVSYDDDDVQHQENGSGESSHHFMTQHGDDNDDVTRVSMIPIGDSGGKADSSSSASNHEEEPHNPLPIVTSVSSVIDLESTSGSMHSAIRKRKYIENHTNNNINNKSPSMYTPPPPTNISSNHNQVHTPKQHSYDKPLLLHSQQPINNSTPNAGNGASSTGVTKQQSLDEDEHYCLSLVGRMKKLDSKKKAYLRSTVEKLFLDFELGYVQFPKQSSYPPPPPQ
eukprot:TCONS_00028867-protein